MNSALALSMYILSIPLVLFAFWWMWLDLEARGKPGWYAIFLVPSALGILTYFWWRRMHPKLGIKSPDD